MDQFNRKLVLITGGSSGIGLSLARQLVTHGAYVYILARRLDHLTSTILDLKKSRIYPDQKIGLVSADVSREKSTIRILEGFISKVGVPNFIFNSAGIVFPGQVENIPLDEFHSLMDTNFFGTVLVTKTFLPDMLKEDQDTSSTFRPSPVSTLLMAMLPIRLRSSRSAASQM